MVVIDDDPGGEAKVIVAVGRMKVESLVVLVRRILEEDLSNSYSARLDEISSSDIFPRTVGSLDLYRDPVRRNMRR